MDEWNLSIFEVFIYTVLGVTMIVGLPLAVTAMLLLTLAGALWSPFAAAICDGIAQRSELDPSEGYARDGFVSSCSLFLPWIYLVSRMRGKTLPGGPVVAGYCALFTLWMFGTWIPGLGLSWAFFWADNAELGPFGVKAEQYELRHTVFTLIISMAPSIIAVVLWVISLWKMLRIYRNYRRGDIHASQSATIAPTYLRPFQYAVATFVVTWSAYIYIMVFYDWP